MEIARVTWDGRVATVTLPEGLRPDGDAMQVRRDGRSLVLEPVPPSGPDDWSWLDRIEGLFSEDAAQYALEARRTPEPTAPEEKSPFD